MCRPNAATGAVLVVGSGNRKKAAELVDLLAPRGIDCLTLADFDDPLSVEESGVSFAENAAIKASRQAMHLSCWVLADDAGLVVDALDGAPGLFSARYAGPRASDGQNRDKLLHALAGVPLDERTARFVCHLALADPTGQVLAESSGQCSGRIRLSEAGCGGFGYDPLFEVVEYHRTFGELSGVVKSCLSHRARAARAILPRIVELVAAGERGRRG